MAPVEPPANPERDRVVLRPGRPSVVREQDLGGALGDVLRRRLRRGGVGLGLGHRHARRRGGRPDDERIDRDRRVTVRTRDADRDAVRARVLPANLEQDAGRLEGPRERADGLDVLAVDPDLGLASGRPDRADPGDGRSLEGQGCLRALRIRKAHVPTQIGGMVGPLPAAAVVDLGVRLGVPPDRPGVRPCGDQGSAGGGVRREGRDVGDDQGDEAEAHDPGGQPVPESSSRAGGGWRSGVLVDPAGPIPKRHSITPPFGNPASSVSPVALRPRLATGVLFRGSFADALVGDRLPSIPASGPKGHKRMVPRCTTGPGPMVRRRGAAGDPIGAVEVGPGGCAGAPGVRPEARQSSRGRHCRMRTRSARRPRRASDRTGSRRPRGGCGASCGGHPPRSDQRRG